MQRRFDWSQFQLKIFDKTKCWLRLIQKRVEDNWKLHNAADNNSKPFKMMNKKESVLRKFPASIERYGYAQCASWFNSPMPTYDDNTSGACIQNDSIHEIIHHIKTDISIVWIIIRLSLIQLTVLPFHFLFFYFSFYLIYLFFFGLYFVVIRRSIASLQRKSNANSVMKKNASLQNIACFESNFSVQCLNVVKFIASFYGSYRVCHTIWHCYVQH